MVTAKPMFSPRRLNSGSPMLEKTKIQTKIKKKKRTEIKHKIAFRETDYIPHPGDLEYVDEKFELPSKVDGMFLMENRRFIALDIGSSRTKINLIENDNKDRMYTQANLGGREIIVPSRLWYSRTYEPSTNEYIEEYRVGDPPSVNPQDWIEIENVKRLFLINELFEINIKGITLRIATLMYELIKGMLDLKAIRTENCDSKSLKRYSGVIVSCPTGTSSYIRKVFYNCVYKALSNFETSPEIFANILIVEEDALSHFLIVKRSNLVKGITLIADIGHESVDICVEERTEKETKVIYRNGEFTGLRSIHDIIKKKFPKENSFKIMEKFFLESEIINLPLAKPQPIFPLLEDCKTEIVNAIKSIVMSIGLTAAYCCVQEIHVIGAVTSSPFFMYHITQELSEAKVNETLDRLRLHLKDDYQNMRFCGCRFYFNPLDRSPLLEGMLYMINTALKLEKPVSFCFEQAIPKENKPQYVLGFLDIDDNGQYGLNVQKDWNSLFLTFDFELAILGLFPIVDLKKIGRITQNNFHQWGIFSFERFGTVFAEVDPSFETTKRKFLISGEVQKDTVTIEIIFSGLGGYRQCELEIGRNGRMERVSISDVPKVVLATKEKDFKTWYGSHYKISITISEKNSFLLSSNQRTLKEEKFGDDFERIRIRKDSNHRAIEKKIVNYTIKKRK